MPLLFRIAYSFVTINEILLNYFLEKNPQNSHSVLSTVRVNEHVVCKKKPRAIHDLEPFSSYGEGGSRLRWLKNFICWGEGSFWKTLVLSMMIANCCLLQFSWIKSLDKTKSIQMIFRFLKWNSMYDFIFCWKWISFKHLGRPW